MAQTERLTPAELREAWDQLAVRASPRKRRLFACAACRWLWERLGSQGREAVEFAERVADGAASPRQLAALRGSPWLRALPAGSGESYALSLLCEDEGGMADSWSQSIGYRTEKLSAEMLTVVRKRLALLAELVGEPGHPSPALPPAVLAWNDHVVRRLAQSAYHEWRLPEGTLDPGRLGILADALLDAGCTDDALLAHLRSPGPHVRGCWVIDLLLGKE
jgi:hypothetical protein